MIPTCISEDKSGSRCKRKTLTSYAFYQTTEIIGGAGYEEEMRDVEKAIDEKDFDRVLVVYPIDWLSDTTLFGTATEVRDGIEPGSTLV